MSAPAPMNVRTSEPAVRVVDEPQVDVRVVDGRVPPERVVDDVERVVRAVDDREPRLEGGVVDRRRDLADATADPVLQLAVDDHRAPPAKPLLALRSPVTPLNENVSPGRDERAVDERARRAGRCGAVRACPRTWSCSSETTSRMPSFFASAVDRLAGTSRTATATVR